MKRIMICLVLLSAGVFGNALHANCINRSHKIMHEIHGKSNKIYECKVSSGDDSSFPNGHCLRCGCSRGDHNLNSN